jgi:transaldolase
LPTHKAIEQICEIVDGPVSAEVIATDTKGILGEGRNLAKIHPNVVVKAPLTPDGLKAVRLFSREGIKTNVTLCFSPTQAIFAAKAGADYVSPFIGRLDDIAEEGIALVDQIVKIFTKSDYKTRVLVASIRNPMHVVRAALIGADVCTVPFKVITELMKHPLTDIGLAKFVEDAKKIPKQ